MELAKKVKELALSENLDYAGIASAESLQEEPERRRPDDYLPGAQSVVSVGIRLGLGAQLSNKLAHQGSPRHTIFPYLWYGFGLPSWHFLDRTALLITRLLEKEGYIAVPVMSASTYDIQSTLMEFSNIHAAVAAGLGELGWCGMVLTPDVGPRARFTSVITNAILAPDPMYRGPRLCNVGNCKKLGQGEALCVKACPTKAFGPDSEEVVIGDKSYKTAKLARFRCMWGSMGLSREYPDIPIPDQVEVEDVFTVLGKREPRQALELMCINERGDYCGKCIMECPVGGSKKVDDTLVKASRRRTINARIPCLTSRSPQSLKQGKKSP